MYSCGYVQAQELDARVNINHTQIETTRTEVFEALKTKLTEFLNNHKWTEIPFRENEKIQCNFNITVSYCSLDLIYLKVDYFIFNLVGDLDVSLKCAVNDFLFGNELIAPFSLFKFAVAVAAYLNFNSFRNLNHLKFL